MKLKLLAILISFFLIKQLDAQVSTFMGYEYLGGNKYKVKLHYFRNCRGIGVNANQTVSIESSSACFSKIAITVTRDTVINRTLQCATGNGCNVSNNIGNIGLEEQIFSKVIDLDSAPYKTIVTNSCCDIYFSFSRCCRSGSLTNGMANSLLTNFSYLNRCFGKTNSSALFNHNAPRAFYCNSTFEYNPMVTDVNKDSLVFSLDTARRTGIFDYSIYNSPLSAQIPITPVCTTLTVSCTPAKLLGVYVGFDFDASTNNIRVTPKDCNEVAVLVNRVDEFKYDSIGKKWNRVGIARFDQQINSSTLSSANKILEIDIPKSHYACIKDTFYLTINSTDQAISSGVSDSTFLTWNTSNTNANIKLIDAAAKNQSALLKWKPSKADISLNPTIVNLLATESNCPNPAQVSKAIQIYVVDSLSAAPVIIDRKNGTLYFNGNIVGGSPLLNNNITWLIDTNRFFSNAINSNLPIDSLKRLNPGKYYINLIVSNASNCGIFYSDSIVIAPYFRFSFPKDTFYACSSNLISIKPIIKDAVRPITYQWYAVGNSALISSDSVLNKTVGNSETLFLNALDANNKNYSEIVHLQSLSLPDLSAIKNPENKCFDGGAFELDDPFPAGCNVSATLKAQSTLSFKTHDLRRRSMVNAGNTGPFTYFTGRFFDSIRNQNYIPVTGKDSIWILAQNNINGCIDSTIFTVMVSKNPNVDLKSLNICQASGSFPANNLLNEPANPNLGSYTWSIDSAPAGLSAIHIVQVLEDRNPSTLAKDYWFNPFISALPLNNPGNASRIGKYKLKFCYTNGITNCETCKFNYVTVDTTPFAVITPFANICENDNQILLNQNINFSNGAWNLKSLDGAISGVNFNQAKARIIDSNKFNPKIGENAAGLYVFYYTNTALNCPVLDSANLTVYPKPSVLINIQADTLYTQESLQLEIIEGKNLDISWENGSIDLKRSIRETSLSAGKYLFIVTALNTSTKCTNKDTAVIQVIKTKRPTSLISLFEKNLKLYPNPSQEECLLSSGQPIEAITLFDSRGRIIENSSHKGVIQVVIKTRHLASGIYILAVKGKTETAYLRLRVNN